LKSMSEISINPKIEIVKSGIDGGAAYVYIPPEKNPIIVIFSWGDGWDHVSVSYSYRCCTWNEMCKIKDMFFRPEECVIQYHPSKNDYINCHPYVLHLWRPQNQDVPMPPQYMV